MKTIPAPKGRRFERRPFGAGPIFIGCQFPGLPAWAIFDRPFGAKANYFRPRPKIFRAIDCWLGSSTSQHCCSTAAR